MPRPRERLLAWLHRRPQVQAWALLAPGGAWLVVFFLVPLFIMLMYSFMPRGAYGGVERGFTFEHYSRFFDPLYLDILAPLCGPLPALASACCLDIRLPTSLHARAAGETCCCFW